MRHQSLLRWLFTLGLLLVIQPAHALPAFSRQYRVTCQMCHSVVPRLNYFGLAFQANYFNWPSALAPERKKGFAGAPLSGRLTLSAEQDRTTDRASANFRRLEVFAADGFRLGGRPGGYYVDTIAATTEPRRQVGDFPAGAFVNVPVAGQRGEWAITAGQVVPVAFQYNPANALIRPQPAALQFGPPQFAFTRFTPGLRLDFYDRRGQRTADGNYGSLEIPFAGQLGLNGKADVGGPTGVFAHVFRRRGWSTLGVFGYTNTAERVGGVLATRELDTGLYLLGAAALGRDSEDNLCRLSLQADYTPVDWLSFTGGLDLLTGGRQTHLAPAAGINYYPGGVSWMRLTAETAERPGNRTFALLARGLF